MKLKEKINSWLRPPRFEDGVQVLSGIGKDGLEYPDPVPMAPAAGLMHPESQADMILRIMRDARLKEMAENEGFDTEEEADDFEVDDDYIDPTTPWEEPFLPPKNPPKAAAKAQDASVPPSPAPATPNSVSTPAEAPVAVKPTAS